MDKKISVSFLLFLFMSFVALSSCEESEENDDNGTSSKVGSVVTVHVCNATTKAGHYMYRVVIKDNLSGKCLLDKSVNIKNCIDTNGRTYGTYKNFEITANPKYKKNNWTVTIYAKGGTYGKKSNDKLYEPYSSIKNKIGCYWHGTYLSEYMGV